MITIITGVKMFVAPNTKSGFQEERLKGRK
jgi:hypothetical protein